jgi:hypothetical protein
MSTKFVTCLYDGLFNTKFCGRQNRGIVFKRSLATIGKIGAPIICYTSTRELPFLQKEFSEQSNIEFRSKDLDSLYFHDEVNQIRNDNPDYYRNSPDWMFRCVEIMWSKFINLKEVIDESENLDNIFWIDSGLSHSGIIHSRFNPNYKHNINFIMDLQPDTLHLSAKNDLIFNEDFPKNLVKFTGSDRILNIVCTQRQHGAITSTEVFNGSVIGGIFGGNTKLVYNYCNDVINYFEKYASEGKLYKEEQIMTQVMDEDKFPLKKYKFDTWYHGDWSRGYFNELKHKSFCDFFDEINPRR